MPRKSRIVLSNIPHHITQMGHNRQSVFPGEEYYVYYLENLLEWKNILGCKVYAFCLMENHIHLIVDPGDKIENLGLLMKRLAGRQTRRVNCYTHRTGSLWEGRYKSSPIQASEFLLSCCRYVDLHPVRAGLVDSPDKYPWSSCRMKTGVDIKSWLDIDPFYQSLGRTREQRWHRYKEWLDVKVEDSELQLIRDAARRGQITASSLYTGYISDMVGRDLSLRGPGRPPKNM